MDLKDHSYFYQGYIYLIKIQPKAVWNIITIKKYIYLIYLTIWFNYCDSKAVYSRKWFCCLMKPKKTQYSSFFQGCNIVFIVQKILVIQTLVVVYIIF